MICGLRFPLRWIVCSLVRGGHFCPTLKQDNLIKFFICHFLFLQHCGEYIRFLNPKRLIVNQIRIALVSIYEVDVTSFHEQIL